LFLFFVSTDSSILSNLLFKSTMWTDISPLASLDTSFTLLSSVEHFLFKMSMWFCS
jgi:hypothetical protein